MTDTDHIEGTVALSGYRETDSLNETPIDSYAEHRSVLEHYPEHVSNQFDQKRVAVIALSVIAGLMISCVLCSLLASLYVGIRQAEMRDSSTYMYDSLEERPTLKDEWRDMFGPGLFTGEIDEWYEIDNVTFSLMSNADGTNNPLCVQIENQSSETFIVSPDSWYAFDSEALDLQIDYSGFSGDQGETMGRVDPGRGYHICLELSDSSGRPADPIEIGCYFSRPLNDHTGIRWRLK